MFGDISNLSTKKQLAPKRDEKHKPSFLIKQPTPPQAELPNLTPISDYMRHPKLRISENPRTSKRFQNKALA